MTQAAPPAPPPGFPAPGSFAFSLTLGGRIAGEQSWQITPEKHAWHVKVQTDFGGVLPQVRRVQTSRLHPRRLHSLSYTESEPGRGNPSFETTFDHKTGLVTVRRGKDEASGPLTADHHDPVSLLLWLRALDDQDRAEVRMVGGHVYVSRLADAAANGKTARVYFLRPGGAYVYVEDAPERRLLRLIQPTDFGPVQADWKEARVQRPEGQGPRRRRR